MVTSFFAVISLRLGVPRSPTVELKARGDSHFTARTDECAYLRKVQAETPATSPRFNFEGNAFWVSLQVNGECLTSAPVPVYRLYNNGYALGKDPNLRYTTDPQLLNTMTSKGWISEGVAFCTRN